MKHSCKKLTENRSPDWYPASQWGCCLQERFARCLTLMMLLFIMPGCTAQPEEEAAGVHVWGRRGIGKCLFQKPRAITSDANNNLYIVDMTGRIQVSDADGKFIRDWTTPERKNGKPCGLTFSQDGLLMVADTHYFRVLFYHPDGTLVEDRTIGGEPGRGPGQFGFVTDVVQDTEGNYYISEYGDYDRIQKFTPEGEYVYEWGGHGQEEGEFLRPQGLVMDEKDHLWVADASNHRIQVFDVSGDRPELLKSFGTPGSKLGELRYPYDLFLDGEGHLFVLELGNHRVQKFTLDGQTLGAWGNAGREVGELHGPWAMCSDSKGRIHVLDSYNHRLQRFEWNVKPPLVQSTDGAGP